MKMTDNLAQLIGSTGLKRDNRFSFRSLPFYRYVLALLFDDKMCSTDEHSAEGASPMAAVACLYLEKYHHET